MSDMPDFSTYDPVQYQLQMQQLQRRAALAQALMGNGQMPQGQMIGNRYVAPSPFQQLASMGQQLAGAYTQNKLNQQQFALAANQQQQLANLLRMPAGGSPDTASPGSQPPLQTGSASTSVPSSGSMPPNGVQNSQGPATPVASAPPSTPSPSAPTAKASYPMLLTGDVRTSQALLSLMGPQEYAKAIAGRYAPTDIEKLLRAAGIDPASPEGRQALQSNIEKQNYIAPIGGSRPGTIAYDRNGRPLFAQPDVAHNVQLGMDANGVVNAAPIPGNVAAQAGLTGAETAAKVSNTPQTFPTAGGGSTVGYPSDVLGLPPSMRGGAAPSGIGPARPPATPGGQAPAAPAASAVPPAQSGTKPLPNLWNTIPKLRIGTSIGAPDSFTQGRLQEAGKKDAELSSKYGSEADLADQKIQYNTEAAKVLNSAETGPSSDWLTENRAKLIEWGVPEAIVPGSGKITPTMELNKNLKQSALQGARAIFGSRMTQMEVRLQHEELSPSTSMTKDAIASLMQQDNIKQLYAKQRADDYGKYIQQGGDPLRFESWYATNFPLTKFAQSYSQPGSVQSSSQTPTATPKPKSATSTQKPWEMNWK